MQPVQNNKPAVWFYTYQKTAMKNNLIALQIRRANNFFASPVRSNSSQKWVNFFYIYCPTAMWTVCIASLCKPSQHY